MPQVPGSSPGHPTIYDSVVELAYTTDLKSVDHIGLAGSSPATVTIYALVAQLVEHWTFNPLVEGSSPSEGIMFLNSSVGRADDC